jgi:hypothetical protein
VENRQSTVPAVATTSTWQPGFSGGIAVADPTLAELEYPQLEPLTQRHLEIIHQVDQTIVTVLELLAPPTNCEIGRPSCHDRQPHRVDMKTSIEPPVDPWRGAVPDSAAQLDRPICSA